MAASDTITVRLPADVKQRLGRLAERTKRTKSFLASEAIAGFVERELQIVEGIERGLADLRKGDIVEHAQAMAELDKAVAAKRR
jgi:predicted transcriptional regulator